MLALTEARECGRAGRDVPIGPRAQLPGTSSNARFATEVERNLPGEEQGKPARALPFGETSTRKPTTRDKHFRCMPPIGCPAPVVKSRSAVAMSVGPPKADSFSNGRESPRCATSGRFNHRNIKVGWMKRLVSIANQSKNLDRFSNTLETQLSTRLCPEIPLDRRVSPWAEKDLTVIGSIAKSGG